jgi:hypothetical protein
MEMSWYWNEISDKESAKYATTTAVWISYLIAAVYGVMDILDPAACRNVVGANSFCWLIAFLFSVIGWQIGRLSRVWALVGFLLYSLGMLASIRVFGFRATAVGPVIVAIIFLAVYVNALRGTFAYRRYVKLQAVSPTESMPTG